VAKGQLTIATCLSAAYMPVSFTVQRLCGVLEASTSQHILANEPNCFKLYLL